MRDSLCLGIHINILCIQTHKICFPCLWLYMHDATVHYVISDPEEKRKLRASTTSKRYQCLVFSWGPCRPTLGGCTAAKLLDLSAWKSTSVHFAATHALPWRDSRSWVRDPEAIARTSGKSLHLSHRRTDSKR